MSIKSAIEVSLLRYLGTFGCFKLAPDSAPAAHIGSSILTYPFREGAGGVQCKATRRGSLGNRWSLEC